MKYSDYVKGDQPWYAARCVFYDRPNKIYEERIVLVRANSEDEAMQKANKSADRYAEEIAYENTGFIELFHLFDEVIEDGSEVFSSMRSSELNHKDYISSFFYTGDEIQDTK